MGWQGDGRMDSSRRAGLLAWSLIPLLLSSSPCPPYLRGEPSPLATIAPAPSTKLTDSRDQHFDLASRRGKCVLVGFAYTTCEGSCPLTTAAMARCRDALRNVGLYGGEVEFVTITLDPERDTPEALRIYARIYDAEPDAWHFLTGPADRVGAVIASWGMWTRRVNGVLDHPSRVFLVDPEGRQREIYNLESLVPRTVVDDVRGLLEESRGRSRPG